MCTGGRLIADFVAGTYDRPGLPEVCEEHLTKTVDGVWVVWAYKLALPVGDRFMPLTGGSSYPADARATCRLLGGHDAPNPKCTCGFHALSRRSLPGLPASYSVPVLSVALSGRVLAFEWAGGGVLWRAERQTVVRVDESARSEWTEFDRARAQGVRVLGTRRHPDDPEGRLAVLRPEDPRDPAPIRLKLPVSVPVLPLCDDDAGWCIGASTPREHAPAISDSVLARAAV